MKKIVVALKAFFTGALMLIPGVSGGAVAMVLGEYDNLVNAVPGIFKKDSLKKSFLYLLIFGLFGVIGVILMSKPIYFLDQRFHLYLVYFIIGTILATIPVVIKKSTIKIKEWPFVLFTIIGIVLALSINFIPQGLINLDLQLNFKSFVIQFLFGLIISVGFILPGISISFLLVIFGIFKPVLNLLSTFNFLPLIPLAFGMVAGIIILTGFLKWALERKPKISYSLILGFLISSGISLIPKEKLTIIQIILSTLSLILGYLIIFLLTKYEKMSEKKVGF